jgi:hypothetical protein
MEFIMNRKQRKQRAAEIRRNQKLARKAGREGAQVPMDADAGEAAVPQCGRDAGEAPAPQCAPATGRRISDERAREMLEDAAEFLQDLVVKTREALKSVAPARVAEAMEVIESKGSATSGTPQQQPRRGSDPLVTMIKQGISASNLLKRIISTLHPKLAKIEVPALV